MHTLNERHRRAVVAVLAALVLVIVLLASGSNATTTPRHASPSNTSVAAAPATAEPVPPDPTTRPVKATASPNQEADSARSKLTPIPTTKSRSVPPVRPTLSAQDKEAKDIAEWWWDVFVIALKKADGIKLTNEQLRQPEIVIVTKSSCAQPKSNLLGPKSQKSLTYCRGKLEFVPQVFMTITDPGKLKVVASGFLYHAVDVAPASQLEGRNKQELLGYLQAQLSLALVERTTTSIVEEAWVVVHPVRSSDERIDLGYVLGIEALEG